MARKTAPDHSGKLIPNEDRPFRLSSRETLFLKYALAPGVATIWLVASTLAILGKARPQDASPWFLFLFLSVGLGAVYIIHRSYGGLKNIWLTADDLLVSNGVRSERIPLRWAVECSLRFYVRCGEAVYAITFDRETAFGSSVDFLCNQCESPAMRRLMTITRWNDRNRRKR
ncbi:MAG TPA: hypothetical protein VF175_15210 [Lacipirellula sp.]